MPTEITKPLVLSAGLFLIPEFSATGGVKYARESGHEAQDGERLEAEFVTKKTVDHVGLLKWSRKIINLAYGVMERYASQTPIGYWVSDVNFPKLSEELGAVAEEAQSFNRAASNVGCGRRVRIASYPIRVQEGDESAAIRLAQTVRERLEALLEALRARDLDGYATAWKRAKNLPRLATGIQAESVVFALQAAKEARAQVYQASKTGETIEPNLDALESAIYLFTDSVTGALYSPEAHENV